MQYLKEEIRESIIEAATEEFFRKGYEKASMRAIAADAGMTVGNMYRYFRNKDELFTSVTGPVYEQIVYFIQHHEDNLPEDFEEHLEGFISQQTAILSGFADRFRREMLILLEGSRGSPYENARGQIQSYLASHMEEHIEEIYPPEQLTQIMPMGRILSVSIIEGIAEILRTSKGSAIARMVAEYLNVFMYGTIWMYRERPVQQQKSAPPEGT